MDHSTLVRSLLDTVSYVVLSTADAEGTPWASPVWFAHDDGRTFYWVSALDSRHSRNLAVRPAVAMVVFDSTVAPNTGQAVYATGRAEQVRDAAVLGRGLKVVTARSVREGGDAWDAHRVSGTARLRLFRALLDDLWILDPDSPIDERVAVDL